MPLGPATTLRKLDWSPVPMKPPISRTVGAAGRPGNGLIAVHFTLKVWTSGASATPVWNTNSPVLALPLAVPVDTSSTTTRPPPAAVPIFTLLRSRPPSATGATKSRVPLAMWPVRPRNSPSGPGALLPAPNWKFQFRLALLARNVPKPLAASAWNGSTVLSRPSSSMSGSLAEDPLDGVSARIWPAPIWATQIEPPGPCTTSSGVPPGVASVVTPWTVTPSGASWISFRVPSNDAVIRSPVISPLKEPAVYSIRPLVEAPNWASDCWPTVNCPSCASRAAEEVNLDGSITKPGAICTPVGTAAAALGMLATTCGLEPSE